MPAPSKAELDAMLHELDLKLLDLSSFPLRPPSLIPRTQRVFMLICLSLPGVILLYRESQGANNPESLVGLFVLAVFLPLFSLLFISIIHWLERYAVTTHGIAEGYRKRHSELVLRNQAAAKEPPLTRNTWAPSAFP